MKPEQLIEAIGGIDDKFITEFAEVKPCKKENITLKKVILVSVAALFVVLSITTVYKLLFRNEQSFHEISAEIAYCVIDGQRYRVIEPSKGNLYGLPTKIKTDMVGEAEGTAYLEPDNKKAEIYIYIGDNKHVKIIRSDGEFRYLYPVVKE